MQEADADYERKRVVGTEELMSGIQPTRTRKTPFELMSGRPDPDDESIYEGMKQEMSFKNSSIDHIMKKRNKYKTLINKELSITGSFFFVKKC